jgi:DNA-binding response OmpR family regulator
MPSLLVPPLQFVDGFNWRLRCPLNVIIGNEIHLDGSIRDAVTRPSARPRVLVVEDDALVALELAESLQAAGFDILGPAGRVERALQLISATKCDAAVLDINLGNETSEPVARLLHKSGTPFVTVSGYSQHQFPDAFAGSDFLPKPLRLDALISVLRRRIEGTKVQ